MFELGNLMAPPEVAQARIGAGGFWASIAAALRGRPVRHAYLPPSRPGSPRRAEPVRERLAA